MPATPVPSIVTGVVWKIERQPGDTLDSGDVIMIMESMKMEIPIEAPEGGTLVTLHVAEGDSVTEGQLVATLG